MRKELIEETEMELKDETWKNSMEETRNELINGDLNRHWDELEGTCGSHWDGTGKALWSYIKKLRLQWKGVSARNLDKIYGRNRKIKYGWKWKIERDGTKKKLGWNWKGTIHTEQEMEWIGKNWKRSNWVGSGKELKRNLKKLEKECDETLMKFLEESGKKCL